MESQSAPPGASCSMRTSSDASCSSCSVASAMNACRYLWGASAIARLLAEHLLHHRKHVLAAERLDDEIRRSRLDGFHHQRLLAEGGAHDHHGVGIELDDLAGGVDARLVRHDDVHGDQVRLELAEEVDGL